MLAGVYPGVPGAWCCDQRRLLVATTTRWSLDGVRRRQSGTDCRGRHAEFRPHPPPSLVSLRARRLELLGTAACRVQRRPVSPWTTAVLPVQPSSTVANTLILQIAKNIQQMNKLRLDSNLTPALHKSFTYLLIIIIINIPPHSRIWRRILIPTHHLNCLCWEYIDCK